MKMIWTIAMSGVTDVYKPLLFLNKWVNKAFQTTINQSSVNETVPGRFIYGWILSF